MYLRSCFGILKQNDRYAQLGAASHSQRGQSVSVFGVDVRNRKCKCRAARRGGAGRAGEQCTVYDATRC